METGVSSKTISGVDYETESEDTLCSVYSFFVSQGNWNTGVCVKIGTSPPKRIQRKKRTDSLPAAVPPPGEKRGNQNRCLGSPPPTLRKWHEKSTRPDQLRRVSGGAEGPAGRAFSAGAVRRRGRFRRRGPRVSMDISSQSLRFVVSFWRENSSGQERVQTSLGPSTWEEALRFSVAQSKST